MKNQSRSEVSGPRVYVILLNYNGWRDTVECLESLFTSDYDNYRVIVCDNGSSDGSVERLLEWASGALAVEVPRFARANAAPCKPIATRTIDAPSKPCHPDNARHPERSEGSLSSPRDPSVAPLPQDDRRAALPQDDSLPREDTALTIIRIGANLGFTGGNNVGLRYALQRGDAAYAWLLNNDTVVAPQTLTALVHEAECDRNIAAVGGTLYEYFEPNVVQCAPGGTVGTWVGRASLTAAQLPATSINTRNDFNFISGACLLARVDVLREVGLLDERFFIYNEDADWCLRMESAGYRLAHSVNAGVWHKGSQTTVVASPFNDFHNLRSALLLVHKQNPARLPVAFAYSLYRCVAPKIVRGQWKRLPATVRAYRDVLATVRSRRAISQ